jgi:hypothetical protein
MRGGILGDALHPTDLRLERAEKACPGEKESGQPAAAEVPLHG